MAKANFFVPPTHSGYRIPGVPNKARIQVLKQPGVQVSKFDPDKSMDLPVLTAAGAVRDLGFPLAEEQAWARFVEQSVSTSVNEIVLRKLVMERAREEGFDGVLRGVLVKRAMAYWRHVKVEKGSAGAVDPCNRLKINTVGSTGAAKGGVSAGAVDHGQNTRIYTVEELRKALYIGPRGGKWADPRHTIPYDAAKHRAKKIHVIDRTAAVAKPVPAPQLGLFDQPAAPKEPVVPEPKAVVPIPQKPALVVPRAKPVKKREKAVEVGEHVWGSRADLAVSSAADLKALSPEEQSKYATKKNLMPVRSVDELLEANFTPPAIVLRRAIESCVQSKAPNSLLERQDYMQGVDFMSRSLDECRTAQEVEDFLTDWMYLSAGKKRDKTYSAQDMETIRKEYLVEHGIAQTRTKDELSALKKEQYETWNKIRDAQIVKMPATHKQYLELTRRGKELSEQINIAEKAFPQIHSLLKWKLDIPRYGGLSAEHGRDGSVTTYLEAPELGAADSNAYEAMASAMGPRMVNLVNTGGTYSTWSRKGQTPKVYKDARRAARDMQKESPEKQLETLRGLTGAKGVGPRVKRPPYRWERDVPGGIDRVGGKPVTTADPAGFARDFGFKNVQFGNWVTEDDADSHLRGAHGALFDLADIMGVDPKAVGLNGRLAIGFGARGAGGASAHYESGKQIINLTKMAGGGSLAHEWAHALDNIIAVASDPEATEADMFLTGNNTAGVDRAVTDALDNVMAAMRWGGDAEAQKMEQRAKELLVRRKAKERLTYTERRNLKSYQAAMSGKHIAATRSSYFEDAIAIGGGGKNSHWTRPHEMFARAFESYVEDTLESDGRRSSYLVTGTRKPYSTGREAGTERRDAQPYPQGAERVAINTAMARLVQAIAGTKSLEKALQALEGGMRYVVDLEKSGPRKCLESTGVEAEESLESAVVIPSLSKAEARGGKYHKRVPKSGGGFHYIYDAKTYDSRDDAHLDGKEAGVAYIAGKIGKCLESAGKKGCEPKDFEALVKRHGPKRVASALRDGVKGGSLAFKKGRFYSKSGPKLVVKEQS